jgi:hypothetical protein
LYRLDQATDKILEGTDKTAKDTDDYLKILATTELIVPGCTKLLTKKPTKYLKILKHINTDT